MRIIEAEVNISSDRHLSIQLPEDIAAGDYHIAVVMSPQFIPQPSSSNHHQRPEFGFMKSTGEILGDVVVPVLPENAWDVLQ